MSMVPDGPAHLTAGSSRLVSFCLLAQRMKCPASRRWEASSLASQVSRLACRAVLRVRFWAVSQSSSVRAALTCCRTATAWS